MNQDKLTQRQLVVSYYQGRPGVDIPHAEAVDWVTTEWEKQTGEVFRDPDRMIRQLSQEGLLIKVRKGVYRYEPGAVSKPLDTFSLKQREEIFKRDDYRCVICGRGRKDGVEIHADHIKPRKLGGKSEIENGQTLCAQHNFLKKTYRQTETGKRMFMRLHDLAKKNGDDTLQNFCRNVLEVYDKHGINGHIRWKKK